MIMTAYGLDARAVVIFLMKKTTITALRGQPAQKGLFAKRVSCFYYCAELLCYCCTAVDEAFRFVDPTLVGQMRRNAMR